MIWKPKEKDLTLEEAVEMAKKELAHYWFGKGPQIAGVFSNGGYAVFPLTAEFPKESWLVLIVDPTQFSGEVGVHYAKEWFSRYSSLHLNILLILTATYGYFRNQEIVTKFVENLQAEYVVAVDVEQTLAPAFGASVPPKVVLLQNNTKQMEFSGPSWMDDAEMKTQIFLRKADPGLPLLPVYKAKQKVIQDVFRVEFGYKPKLGSPFKFPEGIFKEVPEGKGLRFGNFETSRAPGDILHEEELFVTGKWNQDAERISTSDPNATITFYAAGNVVSLVAQSLSRSSDHPVVAVEAGGLAIYEAMGGQDLTMDDNGKSVVQIHEPKLYHVIVNAAPKLRTLTLRFENADIAPVAIYGLRIGQS